MKILALISRLLDYPDESLSQHQADINEIIWQANIETPLKHSLAEFLKSRLEMDLLDWQSEYDALFERGRLLGLWLFEHVHGESRDRGQAMVDLNAKYKEAGLEISSHELPDYIPMFLEFIATQGDDNARQWLLDVVHILALLKCRLEARKSNYVVLFDILLSVADKNLDMKDIRKQVSKEKRDDSKKVIDQEWEEEEVTFGADSLDKSCHQSASRPTQSQRKDQEVPLTWVGFNESASITGGK